VNEHQVGVAESTCASKAFPDAPANQGVLNIVDLSKIVLEVRLKRPHRHAT
jgi:hypothetical protein